VEDEHGTRGLLGRDDFDQARLQLHPRVSVPEPVVPGAYATTAASARLRSMATAPSEPLSQRLAAIRGQLKLLADYL
jgi:hypothetical protein